MQRWSWCPKLLLPWQRDVTTFTLHFLSSTPDFFTQTEQRRWIGRAAQPLRFCPLKSKHARIKVESKIHLSEHWTMMSLQLGETFCSAFLKTSPMGLPPDPKPSAFQIYNELPKIFVSPLFLEAYYSPAEAIPDSSPWRQRKSYGREHNRVTL